MIVTGRRVALPDPAARWPLPGGRHQAADQEAGLCEGHAPPPPYCPLSLQPVPHPLHHPRQLHHPGDHRHPGHYPAGRQQVWQQGEGKDNMK